MMKFDPSSIYNRAVGKLGQNPDWRAITNNSVISALIKSNAEINAETARYMEYLFKESKFDTAQNPSSILSMANIFGYHPKRKRSSAGRIWVSIDPRTHLIGKTISMDTVDSISKGGVNTLGWKSNSYGNLEINPSAIITDSRGNHYVPISSYTLNTGKFGVEVDVVQGMRKSLFIDIDTIRSTYTQSRMFRYLYIPFKISNCEDASSISSRRFFKVYTVTGSAGSYSYKEYRIVNNLLLSEPSDMDVEVYNYFYSTEVFYMKFNNDISNGTVLDLSSNTSLAGIRIDYLESMGTSGNVENLYENFTISNSTISSYLSGIKLYGVNTGFINGGYDEETIAEIKDNAPRFYISNYSVGTKESYENTILNTSFKIEGMGEIIPKKVRVYGGNYLNSAGIKNPVTYISFISNNLEDIATSGITVDQYNQIEESLNYYLGRLKSPQDVLKFEVPYYVALAVGMKCSVSNRTSTEGLSAIENRVMDSVDTLWGPNSDSIDFGNSFVPSNLSRYVMNTYDEISSVEMEVEAMKKLVWSDAVRIENPKSESSSIITHTCRIPFDFSPVFLGNQVYKGFKDFRIGSNYMFRMDIMYKRPSSLNTVPLNKTIFIAEPSGDDSRSGLSDTKFYVVHDQDDIWSKIGGSDSYSDIMGLDPIPGRCAYQVDFVSDVYSDNDFRMFRTRIEEGKESTKNSVNDLGALDNYMIYFSGNYNENFSSIGNGWVEFSFDSLYNILKVFSLYDPELAARLESCPLSLLKCGTNDDSLESVFNGFISSIKDYVEIYVSMRPIDSNLKLITSVLSEDVMANNNKSILYIDSYDSYITSSNKENLTNVKKPRMISVHCTYEEN